MATFQDVVDSVTKSAGGQVKGADVGTLLDGNVGRGSQMEWRYSIVDLLKVLGLDSTLASRATLAQDLGYKGAPNGSAEMNIWVHKQLFAKLAELGAKVPAELTAG